MLLLVRGGRCDTENDNAGKNGSCLLLTLFPTTAMSLFSSLLFLCTWFKKHTVVLLARHFEPEITAVATPPCKHI